jgi:hypothetical protein
MSFSFAGGYQRLEECYRLHHQNVVSIFLYDVKQHDCHPKSTSSFHFGSDNCWTTGVPHVRFCMLVDHKNDTSA